MPSTSIFFGFLLILLGVFGYGYGMLNGNASPTAPHLHFAVQQTTEAAKWYEPSSAINPYPLLVRR